MSVVPEDGITEHEKQPLPTSSGFDSPSSGLSTSASSTNAHLEHLLKDALFPDDSYTADGVYWADLPRKERLAFINHQQNAEAKREFRWVLDMFKQDPAEPLRRYFRKYVMTGMGLFVEGYVLFSIGNLTALFKSAWPTCWGSYTDCNENWVDAVTYLEILGIIVGQCIVGYEGDWIGRKFGLCQDALIMLIGSILLTGVWGTSLNAWVIAYGWSLFIYGIGVGGEYPMTGTKALEQNIVGPAGAREDRLHRGRNVVGAFLMQGWGQVFNQCSLLILLMIFHSGDTQPPFSARTAQATYRVQFGLAVLVHLWLFYHRLYKVHDADVQLRAAKRKQNTSGYDMQSLRLLNAHYWGRLVATAGAWFANDVFFYGTKVFASTFIGIIHPGASLVVTWEYNLINLAVSLCGYYLGMLFIDDKRYGRRNMQQVGFAFDFLIYLFAAIFFEQLRAPGAPIAAFQFMYHFSSFWNQFGPNVVSFLVAGECFPASVRSTAHGFSAACGKLGALLPTVVFHYLSDRNKFWFAMPFGALGVIVTALFLPDTTGLELREIERYWRCVRAGHPELYHGIAIHPHHLSWYERVVLKRDRYYDPKQDKLDRIEELRVLYESHLIAREDETGDSHDPDHSFISADVERYFQNEVPPAERVKRQITKERAIRGEVVDEEKKVHRSRLEETLGGRA
ncbi:major facilitator superfamily domain-containing protein [Rhodotorula diobovata]|uniref:Major facilitator superfamily domain-containing protein n=1 Tax=Rhodotorula diobovata TaxID=5288 RepID=A0A5C5FPH9_9BASI|nr:major facilitator superfamily domain-containing protein [Rhodotorula diobovata]